MNDVDPRLLANLLRKHGAALVLFAQQWCRTPEDVVQEAFLQLIGQSPPPRNVVGWLYQVVRNGAINATRSATRRQRHESTAAEDNELWFESSAEQLLDARAATDAMKDLPARQREVIVARLWGGLSFEDIAELTGSSTSTAYRQYHAGIEALQERLGVLCAPKKRSLET